jgi:dolichol-phosphate mannosyltransferase
MSKCVVIVPTYNERTNLPLVASELLALPDVHLMVVDDRSPDDTGKVADEIAARHPGRVSVLHRDGVRGFGRSYVDGMRAALSTDADLIAQMDADRSHDPADLPRLIVAAADADLVIGSRYVPEGRIVNWPLHRLLLSTAGNRYVRALTGLEVRDVTSGFRCWRRETLLRIPLAAVASDGYAFQVEMTWYASRGGSRIREVPITFVERREGMSKLSGRVILESAILPWRLAAQRVVASSALPGTGGRGTV